MKFRTAGRRDCAPDMTPMIDVTFLLLIFFLVTAQMAQRGRGEVRLPVQPGESAAAAEASGLVVLVRADGAVLVADTRVSAERLAQLAREAAGRTGGAPPVVRADRAAPAAALNGVARALQSGGAPAFRLATEAEAAP
ncbi:MAG: biopolymer transporter ExbD [Chloroflexi bacterium]|nr:biopolymer transporter ExbD [Chloroflexota bacterium]